MKRKWQERLKKVEELASHYERNPLPTVYRPRLSKPSMPSSVWKIFSRQAEAFSYVKTCQEVYDLLGECLYSLYTFKIEHHLKLLLGMKSLSVYKIFLFPILKEQVLVFFVFVGHVALEVSLRSTNSVLTYKLIRGVDFEQ